MLITRIHWPISSCLGLWHHCHSWCQDISCMSTLRFFVACWWFTYSRMFRTLTKCLKTSLRKNLSFMDFFQYRRKVYKNKIIVWLILSQRALGEPFKMTAVISVRLVIQKNALMVSINLGRHWHIPINLFFFQKLITKPSDLINCYFRQIAVPAKSHSYPFISFSIAQALYMHFCSAKRGSFNMRPWCPTLSKGLQRRIPQSLSMMMTRH